ncbi:hypothetical protein [Sporosarcina sp. SAFN-015]
MNDKIWEMIDKFAGLIDNLWEMIDISQEMNNNCSTGKKKADFPFLF